MKILKIRSGARGVGDNKSVITKVLSILNEAHARWCERVSLGLEKFESVVCCMRGTIISPRISRAVPP